MWMMDGWIRRDGVGNRCSPFVGGNFFSLTRFQIGRVLVIIYNIWSCVLKSRSCVSEFPEIAHLLYIHRQIPQNHRSNNNSTIANIAVHSI